jgi:outer membrane protein OmpA-like peptidoglycan-associated protein
MAGELIVYGDFFGRFKTDQDLPLGSTAIFPTNLKHKVQVYQGKITNSTFEHEFKPEKHRILKSFVLSGVSNIEIVGNAKAPFADSRVYDFTQLMIIDPKIERVFSMNNGTYGEISGKVYGKSANRPRISKLDPLSPPPKTDEPGNGNNGDNNPTGSTRLNDDSEIGKIFEKSKVGCLTALTGCMANIWRILGYLLLLLFLWWLIKACSAIAEGDDCIKRDKNEQLLIQKEKERDSIKIEYDKNLDKALANIKRIYFYKNTDEFHDYSLGSSGNLVRLTGLLQVYNDRSFYIIGHHSGKGVESARLDESRAALVKQTFVAAGIPAENLFLEYKEDKEMIATKELHPYMLPDYSLRYYNRNMRVEIKVKK